MRLVDLMLPELDQEAAATRRLLGRLPDALDWAPHPRSMTLGRLAAHLGRLLAWGHAILERDGYDLVADHRDAPPGPATREGVLAAFDEEAARLRRRLALASDAELLAPWTLRRSGQVVLTVPRAGALRRFVLNHLVHHRGQLTVYLRLHDVPLPPLYGPTADEAM